MANSLSDLKGVGEVTLESLKDAGVTTVEKLAETDVETLVEDTDLSERKAKTLHERAKRETIIFQRGSEVAEEYEQRTYVSTGMEAFDSMLGGGWRSGDLTGILGGSGKGKTQLSFWSMVKAVEQTGEPAVYIETEKDRYSYDRLLSLAGGDEDVVDKIWRIKAYDVDQQRQAYEKITENFDSISLIVVDSFTYRLRLAEEYKGLNNLPERNQEIARHLDAIEVMASVLECPVLLTLQVQGNPTPYGSNVRTWGGEMMTHGISYFVKLSSGEGSFSKASLAGNSGRPDDSVLLGIRESSLVSQHI